VPLTGASPAAEGTVSAKGGSAVWVILNIVVSHHEDEAALVCQDL
jgi:hypothetical protein